MVKEGLAISPPSRHEQLLQRTVESLERLARSRDGARGRDGPPRPGDLFVFRETADFEVRWAVLGRHPNGERRLRVVPADLDPRVGSADVGVPARTSSGALTLRCGFGVWLREDAFDAGLRAGFLDPADLRRGIRKLDEIGRGALRASRIERETDEEPDYRERAREILAKARRTLSDSFPRS